MATSKDNVSQKPTLLATKDVFMRVDRKSNVWEYFGWHKKVIGSCWVVCSSLVPRPRPTSQLRMEYITAYASSRVGGDVFHPQLRCGSGYETKFAACAMMGFQTRE